MMIPRLITGLDENATLLNEVSLEYKQLANSSPTTLRNLIASEEIWRYLVSRYHQICGRGFQYSISKDTLLLLQNQYKDYSVFKYISEVEQINLTDLSKVPPHSIYHKLKKYNWCLSVNEMQQLTFEQVFALDVGWIVYEINQENCLRSFVKAFDGIFSCNELSIETIIDLHTQVSEFRYKLDYFSALAKKIDRTQFRSSLGSSFALFNGVCTVEGIDEILTKLTKAEFKYLSLSIDFDDCRLFLTKDDLTALRSNYHTILNDRETLAEMFSTTIDYFDQHPNSEKLARMACADLLKGSPASSIFSFLHKPAFRVVLHSIFATGSSAKDDLIFLMDQYNQHLTRSATQLEKLITIATFTRDCIQLVPFVGGNGRTFCGLLLNLLLLRNQLPLTMLNDLERFIGYSVAQLVKEILIGMINTFTLIKEHELFYVKTCDLYATLKQNKFNNLDQYFIKVVQLEVNARARSLLSTSKLEQQPSSSAFFSISKNKALKKLNENVNQSQLDKVIDNKTGHRKPF